ncbi:uncharacterized protein LOC131631471 [Vicia villosa]|uniref:uncharacterized protein LOC131631471 n=1 Tax=Vicia villosa TaxID=3911 RepID=UPI00273A8D88|nr:uncharacterized protein LOC131631471 [Vicia villosa]
MASAPCFSTFHAHSATRRNSIIIVSSKRKNYLRPKILKILTKPSLPIPSPLPQPPTPQPILSPTQEHELTVDVPADEFHDKDVTAAVEETVESEELRVSVDSAKDNGVFANVSGKDIFKYGGMYLIGAFMFQTVIYFWKLENQRSKLNDFEVSEKEKRNGNIVEDQNVEKKIEEIRLMAREARRIELEKKGKGKEEEDEDGDGDSEIDDESGASSGKLGIEKEVIERLLKLKSKINSNKDSLSALGLNGSGNSAKGGGRNVNKVKEGVVFKKKFKFKSPSTKDVKTPKGFSGTQDRRVSSVKPRDDGNRRQTVDHAEKLNGDKQLNQRDVSHENASGVPLEERGKSDEDKSGEIVNDGKNVEEKMETPNMKTKDGFKAESIDNGGFPKNNVEMSSTEVRDLRTQNSQGSEKDNGHRINGSSGRGFAIKNSAPKQANTRTDMWWLNLRYVLVIFMKRGSNAEGPKGLYSLNYTSKQWEQGNDSYTVAFEDQTDANNFCFILESYFEDLDDNFSANVVPMSIQELNEEIISQGEKVVVVKKRQLQLYAGQLLTDVEIALCSIVEQDQNVP